MDFNHKPFDLLGEKDLLQLIENGVSESKTIDYKETLPGNSDSDKKEFLADISSFANASGGSLIYGIVEEQGIAKRIKGIVGINPDSEIQRLENIIRDGIDPRIPSVQTKCVTLAHSMVVIVRIQRSWSLPHMVTFKGSSRFFSRNSSGKYPLDISEIRSSFEQSGALVEKIRRFRQERISTILSNESAVRMTESAKMILHLIPLTALDPSSVYDMELFNKRTDLNPIHASGWDSRYNFDGFVTFSRIGNEPLYRSYLQIFRNGIFEAVNTSLFLTRNGRKEIPSTTFENELISGVARLLRVQNEVGISLPIAVMLSLIGVEGYIMAVNASRFPFLDDELSPIDRNNLIIPESMVNDFSINASDILKPSLDDVWRASGWKGSPNFQKASS